MKRLSLILAALAASSSLALADSPPGPPPGMRGPPIERLAADLGLDENQKAQVKEILEAQHTRMDTERQQFEASGTRPTREEMKARHDAMDAELREQLSGVLSAEQLKKFDEIRAQHRRHGLPPGSPPSE
jgi:Spy/CpxP family protein refolding chaperone